MVNSGQDIIIKNLNDLIDASGLSDASFSNMLNISLRKLKYIKSGKSNLKLNDLISFADFFGVTVSSLSNTNLKVSLNLRQKLLERYKSNTEYRMEFEKTPNIVYAIRYYLLGLSEFLTPMEVKDVRLLLENKANWAYSSSSLSHALKREQDRITIQVHPTKGGTLLYSKKQIESR